MYIRSIEWDSLVPKVELLGFCKRELLARNFTILAAEI
jgi:hypothetical protein